MKESSVILTSDWLEEKGACREGFEWFNNQNEQNPIKIIESFIEKRKHLDWANWLIVRLMEYKEYVSYAIFAAEQVLYIYEKKYPGDKRPREAIEQARKCISNPSKENKAAAADAAYAAAAYAADAAYAAAAYAAAAAADAAAAAAYAAAAAAAAAADVVRTEMRIRILKYGLDILKAEGKEII